MLKLSHLLACSKCVQCGEMKYSKKSVQRRCTESKVQDRGCREYEKGCRGEEGRKEGWNI